jgi:hypothetical protein
MQRTAKARFYIEGVLPVEVSQIVANYAGEIHFVSAASFV